MSNIYANGRAKALSNSLLGDERINRMIDSGDAEEALKILSEVNFGDGLAVSIFDFEKLINIEEQKLSLFIKSTCDNDDIKRFLLLKSDFHNAELFIKSKYLKFDDSEMCMPYGYYDAKIMRENIMVDEYKNYPATMEKALSTCDSDFVAGKANGMSVGSLFVKAYYDELFKLSRKDKILSKIYLSMVDSANISIAIRSRDFAIAKEEYIEHGTLTINDIKIICEDSLDSVREKFRFSCVKELIDSAIIDAEKKLPLTTFEKMKDSLGIKILMQEKYATEGYIPFLQYCFCKRKDIENVRIILVSLQNGVKKEQIKERLRTHYER